MTLRSSWIRLGVPTLLLLAGASSAGLLAWREGKRAQATAQKLMRDYASFIADKYVTLSAVRYRALMGIETQGYNSTAPLAVLRSFAQQRAKEDAATLPVPVHGMADYYFLVDKKSGSLRFSGTPPSEEEAKGLKHLVSGITLRCSPNDALAYSELDALPGASDVSGPWSGILEFDAVGSVKRAYGLRLNIGFAVKRILAQVITENLDCGCTSGLLPDSLSSILDPRRAASFIIRDAEGSTRFETTPLYRSSESVRRDLSSTMPLRGWTVEIAVNPSVIQPFLPYGGRGAPWPALVLIAVITVGAAVLGIVALRGEDKLFRLREEFISNVSHEFKTPLSRIRLFNELLSRGNQPDAAKRSHYHQVIDRECRRFAIFLENILAFARTGRRTTGQALVRLNLKNVLEGALEVFCGATDLERLRLESHLEEVGEVLGDAYALQQMLINLLDNAVKYSPEGSRIEVYLTTDCVKAKLQITDHGCGMPQKELDRIFEPFYRVPPAVHGEGNRPAGSGIGLSLVRRTVMDHDGTIEVKSTPGTGSTFTVILPLAPKRSEK